MNIRKILDDLIPVIGKTAVDALAEQLEDLSSGQDKPWKQAALMLLADAVQAHGMAGIAMAQKAISDLFDNKVPDIDWASPRTASDIVAKFQNAEAGDKSASRDFFVKMGDTLGVLVAGIIKGMVA